MKDPKVGRLVVTRRVDETLCIGTDIFVRVLGIKGNQVRLGIIAPKDVRVDRQEVRNRRDAESAKEQP